MDQHNSLRIAFHRPLSRAMLGLLAMGLAACSSGDPTDIVALAVQSSDGLIAAYLCATPQSCTGGFLQSDQIYIDLLDQNGTVIETTNPAQGATRHDIAWLPTPGLGYFVAVRARDTGGAQFVYRLNIVD